MCKENKNHVCMILYFRGLVKISNRVTSRSKYYECLKYTISRRNSPSYELQ